MRFHRFHTQFQLWLLLATVILPVRHAWPAVVHSPQWTGSTSLTYNLVNLDGFDPKAYYYCKWGNYLDYNSFGVVDVSFNWLTLGPYNNSNLDLFVTQTPPPLSRVLFPANATWTAPNGPSIKGTATFSVANNEVELYRYLHFRNNLKDAVSGTPIDSSTKKVIVVFHGWNPDSKTNSFDSTGFQTLLNNLAYFVNGTDWRLIIYHWEEDADTGPLELATGATNPTEAAEISHQHGQHLGELLHSVAPGLEKVHLIGHSAGTWAARSTLRYLLANNPTAKVELTLLDPFMPTAIFGVNSSLGEPIASQIDSVSGNNRIYLLENYFADEITLGTQETFLWRLGDINLQVDWMNQDFLTYYDSHDGPVQWYAATLYAAAPNTQPLASLSPFQLTQYGWQRSLFFREPLILQNPQSQTVVAGTNVTLTLLATNRFLEKNPLSVSDLSFQWRKNGTNIAAPSLPSLTFTQVTFEHAGVYSVVVSNAAGVTISAIATLSVNADPSRGPFLSARQEPGNQLNLSFGTQTGQPYRLQFTTNFTTWTTLLTTNAPGAVVGFTDGDTANFPYKFYRVVSP